MLKKIMMLSIATCLWTAAGTYSVAQGLDNSITNPQEQHGGLITYRNSAGQYVEVQVSPSDTRIDLSQRGIQEINFEGNFRIVKLLDLSRNQITIIHPSIGNLVNLKKLNLYGNQIKFIPEFIGNLVNLTKLILSSNQITIIPEFIGNLVNLTWLNLSSNQITIIPDSIGNLVKLTWLNLGANQITIIPESIGNLVKLESLLLVKNQIESIGGIPIEDLPQELKVLNKLFLNEDLEALLSSARKLPELKALSSISAAINNILPKPIAEEIVPHIGTTSRYEAAKKTQ